MLICIYCIILNTVLQDLNAWSTTGNLQTHAAHNQSTKVTFGYANIQFATQCDLKARGQRLRPLDFQLVQLRSVNVNIMTGEEVEARGAVSYHRGKQEILYKIGPGVSLYLMPFHVSILPKSM